MKIREKRLREIVREEIKKIVNESKKTGLPENQYVNENSEEERVVNALGDEFNKFIHDLEGELEDAAEDSARKDEGILTTAGVAAAVPAILNLVSTLGKKAGKYVRKVIGKPPNEDNAYQQWMDKLGDIADELHHHYMKPLEAAVSKFVDDDERAEAIAEHLFHVVIGILLVASGAHAFKAFSHHELSLGTLESVLSAIKSDELRSYITKIFGG